MYYNFETKAVVIYKNWWETFVLTTFLETFWFLRFSPVWNFFLNAKSKIFLTLLQKVYFTPDKVVSSMLFPLKRVIFAAQFRQNCRFQLKFSVTKVSEFPENENAFVCRKLDNNLFRSLKSSGFNASLHVKRCFHAETTLWLVLYALFSFQLL